MTIVFSVINSACSDQRSHMSIPLLKSEICCKFNFDMNCSDFAKYVSNNSELLSAENHRKSITFSTLIIK